MEKQQNRDFPRKLNFNAPLLSTRRPIGLNRLELPPANSRPASWDFCDRIPFSWERIPGRPKELIEASDTQNVDLPPPKLPPGRCLPTKEATSVGNPDSDYNYDDGCSGNVDHDYNGDQECSVDVSSQAIDIFSLAQSFDMVETREKVENLGSTSLEAEDYRGSHSPSFIIQRFLPDAKALAASTALELSMETSKKLPNPSACPRTSFSRAISVGQSHCSMKGCGLDVFFPWRMKPKPCGIKSPVLAASVREKPQWPRRKK